MHTPIKAEMGLYEGGRRVVEGKEGNGATMNIVHVYIYGCPRPVVLYSENL